MEELIRFVLPAPVATPTRSITRLPLQALDAGRSDVRLTDEGVRFERDG